MIFLAIVGCLNYMILFNFWILWQINIIILCYTFTCDVVYKVGSYWRERCCNNAREFGPYRLNNDAGAINSASGQVRNHINVQAKRQMLKSKRDRNIYKRGFWVLAIVCAYINLFEARCEVDDACTVVWSKAECL